MSVPKDQLPKTVPPDQRGPFHRVIGVPLAQIFQPFSASQQAQARERQRRELNVQLHQHASLQDAVRQAEEELRRARLAEASTKDQVIDAELKYELAQKQLAEHDFNCPLSLKPRIPTAQQAAMSYLGLLIPFGISLPLSLYQLGKWKWDRGPLSQQRDQACAAVAEQQAVLKARAEQVQQSQMNVDKSAQDAEAQEKLTRSMLSAYGQHQKQ